MRIRKPDAIRQLANDIEIELAKLAALEREMLRVQAKITEIPACADLFYENIAFKLHNFYTGCERVFSLVAIELNGGLPNGGDWHRQLLARMQTEQTDRKAVVTPQTAEKIKAFLSFRHVIRDIYGFELDAERIENLLAQYPTAWSQFERDVSDFIKWLGELAIALEA